jgi:hypothetical protein
MAHNISPKMSVYISRKKRKMSERCAAKEAKKSICMGA